MIAGLAVTRDGLRDSATVYAGAVMALALAAALATELRLSASARDVSPTAATVGVDRPAPSGPERPADETRALQG